MDASTISHLGMDEQIAYLLNMMSLNDHSIKHINGSEGRLPVQTMAKYGVHDNGMSDGMSDGSDSEDSIYAPTLPASSNPAIANAQADPSQPETQTYPPTPYPSIPLPTSTTTSSIPTSPPAPPPEPCTLLQYIHHQLLTDRYTTTSSDYLETIFTHREAFHAFPQGHRGCALGFSELAGLLERREWRADREEDMEAVGAFRYEARVIAESGW